MEILKLKYIIEENFLKHVVKISLIEMTTLFIFKSNARGMQYGLGTYIHELIHSLFSNSELFIYLISYYNEGYKEFTLKTVSERFTEVCIPASNFQIKQDNLSDRKYALSVVRLISDLIPRNSKVIFQINFIDGLDIAIILKKLFKYPIISVVQFAQWQQLFNGNRQGILGLNINEPSNNIEFTFHQEKQLYQISDRIISVTRYMKDFLISEYEINPNIITIIPNGINYLRYKFYSKNKKKLIKEKLGFNNEDVIILFSGRVDEGKGIFYLIEAFVEACKSKNNLRLVIMGEGKINECFKTLHSFYGKVTFTGFLSEDEVSSFYKIADIGILPSVYDHCPLTILEMMSNKIPLIVSRVPGPDEMIDDNSCVFIDPIIDNCGGISFNTKDISNAILRLSEDFLLRKRLANNAYEILIENFSAEHLAIEMTNFFSTL